MVTVSNYKKRINEAGEEFFVLELQGDIELVQSSQTGNFYATAKKTTISSTFSEQVCKMMIGKTMPGAIIKQQTEEYDYTVPETGEVISLDFRYVYSPDPTNVEETIFDKVMEDA